MNTQMSTPLKPNSLGRSRKKRRFILILTGLSVLGIATGLILFALRDGIVFFHSPSDIVAKNIQAGTRFRLGGLVVNNSIVKGENQQVIFAVTDTKTDIPVSYRGLLPDLFREGQGVVVEGVLQADKTFKADTVLAKHDETYMPREVADALKKQGTWKGEKK
jgi:cytochrome c-type biogenesis protein CcmE